MDEILETWYPDLAKPNKHGLPDAVHADIVLPETVTILAPGRKGRFFWKQASGLVIAVNSAVQIPVDIDMWMVADVNAGLCDWFIAGLKKKCIRVFSEDINSGIGVPDIGDYTFYLMPRDNVLEFMLQPYRQDSEVFRATESIAGIAIDFAVRYGAKVVNLIGVDMEGGYYDDPPDLKRDVVNGYVYLQLQKEIDYFKARGIVFRAISPTRLVL